MNRVDRNKRYRIKHRVNISIKGKRYYVDNQDRLIINRRAYKLHVRSEFGLLCKMY